MPRHASPSETIAQGLPHAPVPLLRQSGSMALQVEMSTNADSVQCRDLSLMSHQPVTVEVIGRVGEGLAGPFSNELPGRPCCRRTGNEPGHQACDSWHPKQQGALDL